MEFSFFYVKKISLPDSNNYIIMCREKVVIFYLKGGGA